MAAAGRTSVERGTSTLAPLAMLATATAATGATHASAALRATVCPARGATRTTPRTMRPPASRRSARTALARTAGEDTVRLVRERCRHTQPSVTAGRSESGKVAPG